MGEQRSTRADSGRSRRESDWTREIRTGDQEAFKQLFYQYCQPLTNYARRFVQDSQSAENLVQEVFLQVWMHRASLDPDLTCPHRLDHLVSQYLLFQLTRLSTINCSVGSMASGAGGRYPRLL